MYSFLTNQNELYSDLNELVRQFYYANFSKPFNVCHRIEFGKNVCNFVEVNGEEFLFENAPICCHSKLLERRILLREAKLSLYKALSTALKRSLPWGALTGVRPTKLAYELLHDGVRIDFISKAMQKNYLISPDKADIVQDIITAQKQHISRDESFVNFYVHIPFCPSRCYYCSFVSTTIEKQKNLVEPYIESLIKEITQTLNLIERQGKKIFSVYVGGGTPTSISDNQFDRVLGSITQKGFEFTVEAGRPETMTSAKLMIMKKHNVTRVSVNPQSLNESVLKQSGRGHSLDDFYNAYEKAQKHGFVINTDLIAGLKTETVDTFTTGLEKLISLRPHNITVHTLSQKSGSILKESQINNSKLNLVENEYSPAEIMMEESYKKLYSNGYIPYYLYRQKLMLSNLENVGCTLPSFQCINNITTMEETLSVYACGAGAISKRIFNEKLDSGEQNTRIERLANVKDIKLYLEQFDLRLLSKEQFILK